MSSKRKMRTCLVLVGMRAFFPPGSSCGSACTDIDHVWFERVIFAVFVVGYKKGQYSKSRKIKTKTKEEEDEEVERTTLHRK